MQPNIPIKLAYTCCLAIENSGSQWLFGTETALSGCYCPWLCVTAVFSLERLADAWWKSSGREVKKRGIRAGFKPGQTQKWHKAPGIQAIFRTQSHFLMTVDVSEVILFINRAIPINNKHAIWVNLRIFYHDQCSFLWPGIEISQPYWDTRNFSRKVPFSSPNVN